MYGFPCWQQGVDGPEMARVRGACRRVQVGSVRIGSMGPGIWGSACERGGRGSPRQAGSPACFCALSDARGRLVPLLSHAIFHGTPKNRN